MDIKQPAESTEETAEETEPQTEWEDSDTTSTMDTVSTGLLVIGCSPVKVAKLNKPRGVAYAKMKLSIAPTQLQTSMASALGEPASALANPKTQAKESSCGQCHAFDSLIGDLKQTRSVSTKQEII